MCFCEKALRRLRRLRRLRECWEVLYCKNYCIILAGVENILYFCLRIA